MTRFSNVRAPHHWLAIPIVAFAIFANTPVALDVRSSSACLLPSLTVPLFDATPAAAIASTPVVTDDEPPSEADVQTSVEQIVACSNTGDPNFAYAAFTPRYLAEQFTDGAGHYLPEFEQSLAMGVAPVEGQLELVGISNFNVLPDLRVQIVIETRNQTETYSDEVILAKVGEYWLIDGIVNLDPQTRIS